MKTVKRFFAIFFILTIGILSLSVSVSAQVETVSLGEIYRDPYGRTLVCARKGYWRTAPENSLSAIHDAVELGADMVEIDIKKTADGVLVLLADDTVNRTMADFGDITDIAALTYSELSDFRLLKGEGGPFAKATNEKIPTLEEVFKSKENCLYLLDASWNLKEDVYALALQYDMLDSVIFLFKDAKTSDLKEWKDSVKSNPMTMTYFKGNVIFSSLSHLNKSIETAESVHFATKVSAGVVFGKTVTNKADGKTRLCADLTDNRLCGTVREDTEIWWDDLISRGYSILITDYTPELRKYIDDCESKKDELTILYNKLVENWSLPDLKSDNYLDYKHAYNNAASLSASLLKDGSSAKSDIATAIFELQKAYDNINNNYDSIKNGTVGMTVTPVRVLLCIVAAVAVICAEVFVYKKKKKN